MDGYHHWLCSFHINQLAVGVSSQNIYFILFLFNINYVSLNYIIIHFYWSIYLFYYPTFHEKCGGMSKALKVDVLRNVYFIYTVHGCSWRRNLLNLNCLCFITNSVVIRHLKQSLMKNWSWIEKTMLRFIRNIYSQPVIQVVKDQSHWIIFLKVLNF